MDERAGVPAPQTLREQLVTLFECVEAATGWPVTQSRSATLEIVRDGSGYTLYTKGKFAGSDLD